MKLSDRYEADLDSARPDWHVQETGGVDADISYNAGQLSAEVAKVSGQPRYETCEIETGYTGLVEYGDLKPGTSVCIRTTERRYAFATVKKIDDERGQIQLDVVVWDPPYEE